MRSAFIVNGLTTGISVRGVRLALVSLGRVKKPADMPQDVVEVVGICCQ